MKKVLLMILPVVYGITTAPQVFSQVPPPVVINEIMYAPVSPEPEWIELLNPRSTPVDIRNWSIRDNSTSGGHTITAETVVIGPGGFVVLTRDTNALRAARMGIDVPVITVTGFPSLNNTGDAVVISDESGMVVDSLFYEPLWGGTGGISLERIDPLSHSADPANWTSSTAPSGATPGHQNAVAILDIDLSLSVTDTINVSRGEVTILSVQVQNRGREDVTEYAVRFCEDLNHNGFPDDDEIITRVGSPGPIPTGSIVTISYRWDYPTAGTHFMLAAVQCAADQREGNNIVSFILTVGYPLRAVVINEIMYDPLPDQAEYVELLNRSGGPIELEGWEISDRPTSRGSVNTHRVRGVAVTVADGGLFVIASDSSLIRQFSGMQAYVIMNTSSLGLNNDGDVVSLRDPSGSLVDSVAYDPEWHNPDVPDTKGRSIERIVPSGASDDARNWSTCTLPIGGTPGIRNSLYTNTPLSVAELSFSPNPFSPDGDGFEDNTVIHLDLPVTVSLISIRIFDSRGRLMRRLVNAEPAGSHGDFIWDGRDDSRSLVRIGMYIVYVEAIDEQGGLLTTSRGVVVLARKLN